MGKELIITEKPSVARDIAAALGGFTEHDGYWESDDQVLTFAVGHLFELLGPEEVDPVYKRWTLDVLPIVPEEIPLKPKSGQSERIRLIKKLLQRDDVDVIVNACDAGREGELIFREIAEVPRLPASPIEAALAAVDDPPTRSASGFDEPCGPGSEHGRPRRRRPSVALGTPTG